MHVFVNHLLHYGATSDMDLTISRHMSRLREHVPIDVEFNSARLQPLLLHGARRLTTTRLAALARRLPRHRIAVPTWQVSRFDLAYHFHIAPRYWGFGRIPPSVLRRHWLTDRMLRASGVQDRAPIRRRIVEFSKSHDACITSTRSSVPLFEELLAGVGARVHYCPFFLPDVVALDPRRLADKCREEIVRVLFVGGDGRRKGVHILLAALAMLEKSVARQIHADIVTKTTIDVASLGGVSCTWHPGLPHDEVMRLMSLAQVFCMPTHHDSYGVVFVEAMSQGCAVIADDDLPRLEMIRDNGAGICVDPTTADAPRAVADALTRLVQDVDARVACMRRAHQAFIMEFAADVVAKKHETIFREVIDRGRRPAPPRGPR